MPNDLHAAIGSGNTAVAKKLINAGADVNAITEQGYSPLHLAVLNNNQEIVELLIQKGAKLDQLDPDGKTPRDLARKSYPYINELFKEIKMQESELSQMSSSELFDMVKKQIKSKIDYEKTFSLVEPILEARGESASIIQLKGLIQAAHDKKEWVIAAHATIGGVLGFITAFVVTSYTSEDLIGIFVMGYALLGVFTGAATSGGRISIKSLTVMVVIIGICGAIGYFISPALTAIRSGSWSISSGGFGGFKEGLANLLVLIGIISVLVGACKKMK